MHERPLRDGTLRDDAIASPLRQPRVWLDLAKLVAAAVVQGLVVGALVGLVVMVLASGSLAEPADAPDGGERAVRGERALLSSAPGTGESAQRP